MIRLHHMAESTCSQRVRLALAEKGLEWESVLVPPTDLRSEAYLDLNPAGVVPTLEHNGNILVESRIICEYLEEAFPDNPLMPLRPLDRHQVRRWSKLYDDKLHLAVFVISFVCWMRARYLAMPDEVRASALPGLLDPVKRRISESLIEDGWESDIVTIAMGQLIGVVDQLDRTLCERRWLCGDRYSLADVDLLTVVQRLDDLGAGSLLDERAALANWLDRARSRSSFALAFDAWRNADVVHRNRLHAEEAAERIAALLASL